MAETADSPLLAELSERDKPWDRHKADSQDVALMYFQGGEQRRCERMLDCAHSLQFALLPQEDAQVSIRLKQARFCRQRHCPVCQWRRKMMWRSRVLKALHPKFDKGKTRNRYILEDYPKARFLKLTLTVENPPMADLRATCQLMAQAWRKLSNRKTFPAIGWVRALEITREKTKRAYPHPHYHILMMVPASYFKGGKGSKYLSKDKWIDMWQQSLKCSYKPSIDVGAIKNKSTGETQGLECGVIEVLKYDLKPDELKLDADWLTELTTQMAGLQSVAVGGIFRDYINEDEPENLVRTDDDDDGEDLSSYGEWWFGYREMTKHYHRTKVVESVANEDATMEKE